MELRIKRGQEILCNEQQYSVIISLDISDGEIIETMQVWLNDIRRRENSVKQHKINTFGSKKHPYSRHK